MFRHTYATKLLRSGLKAETVQKLLGHASVSTTIDTYSKARELHQAGEKPQVARSTWRHSGVSGQCATAA
jgi:site-specific recombinase XerD